jgi:hypothetical protein
MSQRDGHGARRDSEDDDMRVKSTTAFRAHADARAKRVTGQAVAAARFMAKSVNKDGSISMAHQERLEVRRVRHGRGRGEAARPARGDEPRIALRGGRALTPAAPAVRPNAHNTRLRQLFALHFPKR